MSIVSCVANGPRCQSVSCLRETSASFCIFPLKWEGAWARAPGRAGGGVQALPRRNESESLLGVGHWHKLLTVGLTLVFCLGSISFIGSTWKNTKLFAPHQSDTLIQVSIASYLLFTVNFSLELFFLLEKRCWSHRRWWWGFWISPSWVLFSLQHPQFITSWRLWSRM